jgi:hypothetical protein
LTARWLTGKLQKEVTTEHTENTGNCITRGNNPRGYGLEVRGEFNLK